MAAVPTVIAAFAFTIWTQVAFVVAFFDGSLLDSRLDEAAETIISLHADVLTTTLLLISVMLFRRSLTAIGFGISVTAALLLLCLFRKTRTRDRVFVLLIAGTVIVTTFIFHLALPMGVLRFGKDRVADMMLTEARYMPLEVFCNDRTCMFLDGEFREIEAKRIASHPLPPSEFVNRSARAVIDGGHATKFVRSTSFNGTTFSIDGCLARRDERQPTTDYICFSDARLLDGLGRTTAAWMGFLSSVAHATWLFGGTFLLWLHKRRFRIFKPCPAKQST